jgi:hypothetical protein
MLDKKFKDRVMWIDNHSIKMAGISQDIVSSYSKQ